MPPPVVLLHFLRGGERVVEIAGLDHEQADKELLAVDERSVCHRVRA
ncbi:MAG TPA: hypothetical protein VN306_02005 [Mycobacterium sp.]|nr:hypothetical protein [Mycobacterium sp.]